MVRDLVLLLSFISIGGSAVTHSLKYLYTVFVQKSNITNFSDVQLLNEKPFIFSIFNKSGMIKSTSEVQYWKQLVHGDREDFQSVINRTDVFNYSEVHTFQRMYGCELYDNGTTRGYDRYGYDGKDFIGLNLKTGTWTAANNNKAVQFITAWDPNGKGGKDWSYNLQHYCVAYLETILSLETKVRPTASVFHKHSPSPEVVCHATGFFPKAVNITWRKDGQDVPEDVDLRETLPNQDGSFQKRSVLKVPAEDLQKHKYTCVIQHSSLKEEMVLDVAKDGGSIALIIGVVAGLVVLIAVITAGVLYWRKKKKKKKNSDDENRRGVQQNGFELNPLTTEQVDVEDTTRRLQ